MLVVNKVGSTISNQKEIEEEVVRLYGNLIGMPSTNLRGIDIVALGKGKNLTLEQRDSIISPITDEEIVNALKGISDNTSPSFDGYGAKFFKSFWDITKYNVREAVREFFDKEKMFLCF